MQIIKEVDILSLYLGDIVINRVNDVALVRFKQITKISYQNCVKYLFILRDFCK